MVLTEITKPEQKRFEELQKQGMLPYEAMARLETERKLGMIPEEAPAGFITKENWWFYGGLSVIGGATLYMYVRARLSKPATTPTPAPLASKLTPPLSKESSITPPPLPVSLSTPYNTPNNTRIENIQKTLDNMEIKINKLIN